MKPVLLIDCYLDSRGAARNFVPWLGDIPVEVIRPPHEKPGQALPAERYRAVLISGSGASACDLPEWAEALLDPLRGFARHEVPMLGVCFGHQIIARALFGKNAVRLAAVPEVGWRAVTVTASDPLFDGIGPDFRVFVSHRDEVVAEACPASGKGSMRVFAHTQQCANHAFRIAELPVWGVQFHAEMAIDEASELVHAKATAHPELGLVPAQVLASASDERPLFGRIMQNFLLHVPV